MQINSAISQISFTVFVFLKKPFILNLLTFYSYVYDRSLEISEVKATIFSMQGFSVIFSPLSLCVHCDMLNLGDFSCNAKCVHFLKGSSRQCILYMMTWKISLFSFHFFNAIIWLLSIQADIIKCCFQSYENLQSVWFLLVYKWDFFLNGLEAFLQRPAFIGTLILIEVLVSHLLKSWQLFMTYITALWYKWPGIRSSSNGNQRYL